MKTCKWKTARLDYIVKQSKTIIHMHRGVYEFYYALINFMPHSLPWAQRRFDKLRLHGLCIVPHQMQNMFPHIDRGSPPIYIDVTTAIL